MTWQMTLNVSRETLDDFIEALEAFASTVSYFEQTTDKSWLIQAFCSAPPPHDEVIAHIALIASLKNVPCPHIEITEVPEKDWVSENQRSFPPLEIGSFYLYGGHIKTPIPTDKLALKIDAGLAFGTGSHETTSGCLLALQELAKKEKIESALDLGCGTGILAFAIAKLWRCPVWGSDNDPDAIVVARQNAAENHIDNCHFQLSQGFADITSPQKFDLITANILANPLIELAPAMANHISPKGWVILSGILSSQAEEVLNAYRKVGFILKDKLNLEEWSVLVLQHL